MICDKCNRDIQEGEEVRAEVMAVFHTGYGPIYALEVSDCLMCEHIECSDDSGVDELELGDN